MDFDLTPYLLKFNGDMTKLDDFLNLIDSVILHNKSSNLVIIILQEFKITKEYRFDLERIKDNIKELKIHLSKYNIDFFFGVVVSLENYNNSNLGLINNLKQDFDLVIGRGGLNKTNRFFLEQTRVDFLLDPHSSIPKLKIDFIHHFNSGLNQVLGNIAREKEIGILYSLNFFHKFNKYGISKEIGRINQNLMISRKFNLLIGINFIIEDINQIKNVIQLNHIYNLFILSNEQRQNLRDSIIKVLNRNSMKKDNNYINENIRLK